MIFVHAPRTEQDDRKFCDLRRLKRKQPEIDPAVETAVGGQEQHDNEQQPRHEHHGNRKQLKVIIPHFGDNEHRRHADERKHELALEVIGAVTALIVIGIGVACRKQHDKADGQNRDDQQQKRNIQLPERKEIPPTFRFRRMLCARRRRFAPPCRSVRHYAASQIQ